MMEKLDLCEECDLSACHVAGECKFRKRAEEAKCREQEAETFTKADLESLAEYVAHDISGGTECYGSNVHKIIDAFLAQRRKP